GPGAMRRPWARGSRELTETEIGLGPAAGTVALVAIDRIVEPSWRPDTPDNGRDFLTVAASVSVKGISQPVVLRRRRRGDYELVDGGRRVRAARANGLCEVPALIADLSDLEALLTGWDAIVRFGVSDDQRIDLAARLAAAGLPLDQINHRLASAPFRIHIEPREDTTHGDAVAFAGDDDATVVHNQEAPSAMRDHADA